MKVSKSVRRKVIIGTAMIAPTATTGFAQFGIPSIVFNLSSYPPGMRTSLVSERTEVR